MHRLKKKDSFHFSTMDRSLCSLFNIPAADESDNSYYG